MSAPRSPYPEPHFLHLGRAAGPVQVHVGEQPVPRVGLPGERRVEQVSDPAVRAVAADDEARADAVLASRQVAHPGADVLRTGGEIKQLDAGLDAAAQLGDPGPEQRLGAVLGQMQNEPECRSGVGHVDAEQAPATRVQPDAAHAVTLVQKTVGDAHHVQRFQCARGFADRPAEPGQARVLVDHWVLPKEAFPPSLWADLDAYLAMRMKKGSLSIDNLLSEEEIFGNVDIERASPMRPSTAALVAYRVRQLASALVLAGHLPADAMIALKVMVGPATVNAGLKVFVRRAGGIRNSQIRGIASDMKMIAQLWVKSPKADLNKLNLLVTRTRPKHEGLPDSARRSIAAFSDVDNVREFLQLPEAIVANAERQKTVKRRFLSFLR